MNYSKEMQQGKAAEHLVVADLLLTGHAAFLSDAGAPFDIVVAYGPRLLTIQVRSTRRMKRARRSRSFAYRFALRHGRNGRCHTGDDIDIFAFVALDTRKIAYIRKTELVRNGKLIQLLDLHQTRPIRTYSSGKQRTYAARCIDGWSFVQAAR